MSAVHTCPKENGMEDILLFKHQISPDLQKEKLPKAKSENQKQPQKVWQIMMKEG